MGLAAVCVVAGLAGGVLYFHVLGAGFRPVVADVVYRTGQPSPDELASLVDRYGFRTVVSLRGDCEPVRAEKVVLDERGVPLAVFEFSEGYLPHRLDLQRLIRTLETAEKPILLHCRSGVNRTGMAAGVAEMVLGGADFSRAMSQLPKVKTNDEPIHIGDVLRDYGDYCQVNDLDPSSKAQFKHWVDRRYSWK